MRFRDGCDSEKYETGEEQNEEHAHHYFDILWIAHKEMVVAGHRVNYYCEVFGVTALIRANIWARTLAPKELSVAS
jgi:hypothetical protein